jgi:Holliday junction resolvasome RuvABC endonuclease subunit
MRIIGFDPGFASLGVAIASIPRQIDDVVFTRVGCISTTKCDELSAAADLTMRASAIAENLIYFVEEGREYDCDIFAVCIEGMSYPRHTQAAVKLGAANGVVGSLLARWLPEVVVVEQPQRIRKDVLGIKSGRVPSEESVHAHLLERYPELSTLLQSSRNVAKPHILDAAACVVAAYRAGRLDP